MINRRSLSSILSTDRKVLYIALSIVMLSVLTLTVVYAALSTTLNISGNAEVSAASWDIYLDNVKLNSSSATLTVPTIIDKTTASFSTTLTKPGDFYEFTIDVVNDGSIDAMIDSVVKMPKLSTTQTKYINYIIEYENGESISTKQLVSKDSFVRLKVKVEFRKDISVSDLPTQSETLDLSFKVNYVQSDDSVDNISIDNNGKLIKIVSGDYNTVGSEICIGQECFYVMSSTDDTVTMLSKYNLYVSGYWYFWDDEWTSYGEEATGKQDPSMYGYSDTSAYTDGIVPFSATNYWYNGSSLRNEYGVDYPVYVYDSNSSVYNYVENYKTYLEGLGVVVDEARLIKIEELEALGCNRDKKTCKEASNWVYSTTYWSGVAYDNDNIFTVDTDGVFGFHIYSRTDYYGVRPVIKILKSKF